MKRRHFIALGAAGIGSAATLHWAGNRPVANGFSAVAAPDIYTSQNGLLEVDLTRLAVSPVQVGDGPSGPASRHRTANLLSFNGQKPRPPPRGPPRRYRPNSAAQPARVSPPTCTTTGCTSPPRAQAINVFLQAWLRAKRSTYEFTIPADHPAGTFWYQAPITTTTQQNNSLGGLAGLFVIRGEF